MQITLPNPTAVIPQWLMVTVKDFPYGEAQWEVITIEIYAEPECVTLLADDIWAELPPASQESVIHALQLQERDELNQVLKSIMTQRSRSFS